MKKINERKPSEKFKLNLKALKSILKKYDNFEETYHITLISMVYVYFENFIKELIDHKNQLISRNFPRKLEDFNELESILYFSSQEKNIDSFIKKITEHKDKKEWEKIKKCHKDFNKIIAPVDEIEKINFQEFEFKQNTGELIKKFKNEFGEEIINNIKLEDDLQIKNPIKSIEIKSFIDGKTFYSKYLSIPRSKSIHEAKVEEIFYEEIIKKNKLKIWLKLVKKFVDKIETEAIKKITSDPNVPR